MNLNERVAIEVMGWKISPKMPEDCYATDEECKNHWWFNDGWGWGCARCQFDFSPTTDGNDMLRVIEKKAEDGWYFILELTNRGYRARFCMAGQNTGEGMSDVCGEAVCLAALEAVKDD